MKTLSPQIFILPTNYQLRNLIRAEILGDIRHPSGRLFRTIPTRPANTLLKQFFNMLNIQMSQTTQYPRTTANTTPILGPATTALRCNAAATSTAYGLLIGTGTDPVLITEYKLQTQVTANITHSAHSYLDESFGSNGWRFSVIRQFTNATGSTVPIAEVAWYTQTGADYYCLDRTAYAVSLPNGKVFTLTYRFSAGS